MQVVVNNSEHFTTCALCGQEFDMRNLGAVLYHEHQASLTGAIKQVEERTGRKVFTEPDAGPDEIR